MDAATVSSSSCQTKFRNSGEMETFKIGQVLSVGRNGEKGKLVDIVRPIGSYAMYKVHMFGTGQVRTAAKHELVKGLPDSDFANLFDECFEPSEIDQVPFTEPPPRSPPRCMPPGEPEFTAQPLRQAPAPCPTPSPRPRATTRTDEITNDYQHQPDENAPPPTSRPNAPTRFVELDMNPEEYRKSMKNNNTELKTKSNIKLLKEFLINRHEYRDIEVISPEELNEYLQEFVLCVRQRDGAEYEPSTLRGILGSIDRYLREQNYGKSIIKGDEFRATMQTFSSKSKQLKGTGRGNKDKAAAPLSDGEVDQLYEQGQLGDATPTSMINTLWLNNTLHFGMRGGGSEHRQLLWGDVTMGLDVENNSEYLEFNERQTKTRTGVDLNNIRQQKPRMYATATDRCPVKLYKRYADKRPEGFSGDDQPFYLATVTHCYEPAEGAQWFLRGPIGKNKLNTIMRTMAEKAKLPALENGKRLTNTSVRKRLCQKLLAENVPDTHAVHITGHKRTDSLNNYRVLTNNQQQNYSNILSKTTSTAAPVPCPTTTARIDRAHSQPQSSGASQSMNFQRHSVRMPSLFQNATISGGTINITINQIRKRPHEPDSDLSQEG